MKLAEKKYNELYMDSVGMRGVMGLLIMNSEEIIFQVK